VYRTVESKGRDRDKGGQVERARDQCGLPQWTHPGWFRCHGSVGDGHASLQRDRGVRRTPPRFPTLGVRCTPCQSSEIDTDNRAVRWHG
jgi:hypothetical protein